MIPRNQLAAAEYIVDTSGAVDLLLGGMRRDRRGRPADPRKLRLLLIGMFLTVGEKGSATVADIHRVLTRSLSLDDQVRLGVTDDKDSTRKLPIADLYYLTKRLDERLGYGTGEHPDLDDAERDLRHQTIQQYCDQVMDVFDLGWASRSFALDATGIWSWARGPRKPRASTEDPTATDTPDPTDTPDARNTPATTDPVDRPEVTKRDDAGCERDTGVEGDGQASQGRSSFDLDAAWGVKTAKTGGEEVFFGYHEHTLVQTPGNGQSPDTEPRLICRFELTPANADVVEVSLGLLDRLRRPARDLAADRHYHYKVFERWLSPLTQRGIRQHHDLRSDEQGFVEYERMRFAAGWAHCPATPDDLGTIPRPAPTGVAERGDAEEWVQFRGRIARREAYAMRRVNSPDTTGAVRYECPAIAGKLGCPLRDGTVQAATLLGLPVIDNPPDPTRDHEPLPRCCTQATVKVTPPPAVTKLAQPRYWGSDRWEREWAKRTYVEGSYGNRKNRSTENLSRGLFRFTGLTMTHLVLAMVNAHYNLRMLRNWHDRTGLGDPKHPLLVRLPEPLGYLPVPHPADGPDTGLDAA